jgi:hypothetical protein
MTPQPVGDHLDARRGELRRLRVLVGLGAMTFSQEDT